MKSKFKQKISTSPPKKPKVFRKQALLKDAPNCYC